MSKPRNSVQHSSELRWLPLSELNIDPQAQRALRPSWVKGHEKDFDPEQVGYIVVNLRSNGKHYVIDGQHRKALMEAIGWSDQMVPCELFKGLSQAEEAEVFLARNDRIQVRTYDKFRVAVTAGEEGPCDIDRIVRFQGLLVGDQEKDGNICAVAALQKVYSGAGIASEKEGPAALARTLRTLQKTWGRQSSSFNGTIIEGMGLVQLRFNGAIDQDNMVTKLAPFPGGAAGLLGKAKALRETKGRPVHHCVAAIIVDLYNKGRRKSHSQLETWWS